MSTETLKLVIIPEMKGATTGLAGTLPTGTSKAGGVPNLSAVGKGLAGGLGGIGKMITAALGPIGVIVAVIAMIASSNKGLMNVLGRILKMIGMIVRPITDILMVALMPLMAMLKPVAMFFMAIMKPYYRKAMEMIRAGNKLYAAGEKEAAGSMWSKASLVMLGGLVEMGIAVAGEMLKGMVNIFAGLATMFINVIGGLGNVILGLIPGSEGAKVSWNNFIQGLLVGVQTMKTDINAAIDVFITQAREGWRGAVLSMADEALKSADKIYDAAKKIRDAGNMANGGGGGGGGGRGVPTGFTRGSQYPSGSTAPREVYPGTMTPEQIIALG